MQASTRFVGTAAGVGIQGIAITEPHACKEMYWEIGKAAGGGR